MHALTYSDSFGVKALHQDDVAPLNVKAQQYLKGGSNMKEGEG